MPKLFLHFVYGLTDPRFSDVIAVRYVGVTLNPNQRYQFHLSCPKNDPLQKNTWVQDLQREDLEPGMEIFDTFMAAKNDKKQVLERETYWIKHYLNLGAQLLNIQKNDASGSRNMFVELLSGEDTEQFLSNVHEPELILDGERVLDSKIVIHDIDFDGLFYLLMNDAIGEPD